MPGTAAQYFLNVRKVSEIGGSKHWTRQSPHRGSRSSTLDYWTVPPGSKPFGEETVGDVTRGVRAAEFPAGRDLTKFLPRRAPALAFSAWLHEEMSTPPRLQHASCSSAASANAYPSGGAPPTGAGAPPLPLQHCVYGIGANPAGTLLNNNQHNVPNNNLPGGGLPPPGTPNNNLNNGQQR